MIVLPDQGFKGASPSGKKYMKTLSIAPQIKNAQI